MNTGVEDSLSHFEGNFFHPGIKPGSPALQVDSLPAELPLLFMNFFFLISEYWYFPGGPVKNPPSNAGT